MATIYADPAVTYADPDRDYWGRTLAAPVTVHTVTSTVSSATVTAEASAATVASSATSPAVVANVAPMTPVEGQTVVIGSATGPFRDRDGTPVDPTDVALTVTDPGGATAVYTGAALNHPAVGVYEAEVTVDAPGYWRWRLEGSIPGDGTAVDEGFVCVVESSVGVGS